jgi:hypothetical protein
MIFGLPRSALHSADLDDMRAALDDGPEDAIGHVGARPGPAIPWIAEKPRAPVSVPAE